jgi:hypothetical protein
MTIAIAAEFPWGRVRSIIATYPGLTAEQGIVFATDSRFSFGANPAHDDLGRKLYAIARNAAVVFSGDVLDAQAVVTALREYGQKAPRTPTRTLLRDIQELCREALSDRPDPVYGIQLLIGICDVDGQTQIIRVTSESGFSPLIVPGVQVVGSKEAERAFLSHLDAIDREHADRGNYIRSTDGWNLQVVAALSSTLRQPGMTRVIGGRIQTVLLTREGMAEQGAAYVSAGGDPSDIRAWQTATLPLASVHGYVG